ncbi:MAG: hypothetical protein NTZ26_09495 [Candidatus Aminicenantes bacterium]|nr:hypothetical protein [Candidatus Aminicenantes bacterium]
MNRRGLTMIEALLSLCLLSLMTLGSIEVFSSGRRVFFRMSAAQEKDERARAGLDKARSDLREAGLGLSGPARFGIIESLSAGVTSFVISCLEKEIPLSADSAAGETFLALAETRDLAAGRRICLFSPDHAETGTIAAVQTGGIVLYSPLSQGCRAGDTVLLLIRNTEIFWDGEDRVLRRRVNAGAAQPLIEEVAGFACRFDAAARIIRLEIRLAGSEEAPYAATVFAKNLAFAGSDPE